MFVFAALVLPADALGARYEGESFTGTGTPITGLQSASHGGAWLFTASGTATRAANEDATSVVVRVRVPRCTAHLVVQLDGVTVIDRNISGEYWKLYGGSRDGHVSSIAVTQTNVQDPKVCDNRIRLDYAQLHPRRWRPFSADSPWNSLVTATTALTSTQLGDLGSSGLSATGTPSNPTWGSPVYFATGADPRTTNVRLTTDWSPQDEWRWDGRAVPVPAGAKQEAGSDGHLTIVSPDRTVSFEFWGVTSVSSSGITAKVIAMISLTGPGYADASNGQENSARGSGVPLIDTSVRCEEVRYGIQHAFGLTVPANAAQPFIPPASHSDGSLPSAHLMYGQRLVLRPDFPETGSAGRVNVIKALKSYGVFVVDQGGGGVEIDAFSPVDPAGDCAAAGFDGSSLSDIHGSDFRLATSSRPDS